MRHMGLFAVVAFAVLALLPGLAAAQDLPVCGGVGISGPAQGAVIGAGYRANVSWTSEPTGAVRSEVASVELDPNADGTFRMGDGKRNGVQRGLRRGMASNRPGTHSWSVIFYGADGQAICMTPTRTYVVPDESGKTPDVPVTTTAAVAAAAVVQTALGRYIIRIGTDNTYYTGHADRTINGDDYNDTTDADDWKARGYTGLEIYGNQRNNIIVGSDLSDLIYGGDESCDGSMCNYHGHLGDDIKGGAGDDEIHGGDESCDGEFCTADGSLGDTIDGGDGNDTIFAGNESCSDTNCSVNGLIGDSIDGGEGTDTIDGGLETCPSPCTGTQQLEDALTASNGGDSVTNVP